MSDLWATPQALFDKLDREFNFSVDVCALPENAKCAHYFTPDQDGLSKEWVPWNDFFKESVWMNPPYGKSTKTKPGIDQWMEKAYRTSLNGVRVVCLIPNRSNAPWWHDYVMKAREIRFIKHKVSFEGEAEGVPFWGSVIVVFGPGVACGKPSVSTYMQPKHEVSQEYQNDWH